MDQNCGGCRNCSRSDCFDCNSNANVIPANDSDATCITGRGRRASHFHIITVINGGNKIANAAVIFLRRTPSQIQKVTLYPDIYSEEVAKTVRDVFGEIAACKVAHSQKLRKHVTEEELDQNYRNEAALTIALMGLMAEDSVIAQRLGKLGRKKPILVTAA